MNRTLRWLACLICAAICADAGPLAPAQVSSEAKWLVHFDAERFRTTLIGKYYVDHVLEKHVAHGKAKHSFDFGPLLRTIKSVTGYGTDYDKASKSGVLILTADGAAVDGLENHLSELAEKGKLKRLQRKPFPLYKPDKEVVVGFLESGTLLIGKSEQNVEEAWGVIAGKRASLAKRGTLGGVPAPGNELIFVGAADAFKEGVSLPAKAKMFRKTESLRVTLADRAENLAITISLKAEDAEVATQIKQVAEGVLAWAAMEREEDKDLRALAKSASITVADATVTASFEFPQGRVIEHLKREEKKTARK